MIICYFQNKTPTSSMPTIIGWRGHFSISLAVCGNSRMPAIPEPRQQQHPNACVTQSATVSLQVLLCGFVGWLFVQHLVPCVGYVVTEKKSRHRLRADVIDPLIEKNSHRLKDPYEWPQLRGEPKVVYKVRPVQDIATSLITKSSSSRMLRSTRSSYSASQRHAECRCS